ncbi:MULTISPECIES: hypothetical protein [Sphingobacterium]|uniref:Uncharacterized protein n=1 Tax=Sphingobacterium cellulitidis TaxID=1768011 RepID=A0A8H9KW45_9SPHI|nr:MULTISPECIES: hypothetical protein [Sphingobacterium]MBA8987419.1 hypothetical protein [Sphingobacterium soli]WFB63147.1 hypothetical protein PZ892_15920 [Sphingobacterium sp. WM]GGE24951.1 hypothetical protein GCM10011516_23280 [Sphingobacterium soli]
MEEKNYPIRIIADKLQLEEVLKQQSEKEQFEKLANYLDYLVSHDFNKLISILYRIDVSEDKARRSLAEEAGIRSAGHTLARLLLEREAEKIKFRKMYKKD